MQITVKEYRDFRDSIERTDSYFCRQGKKDVAAIYHASKNKSEDQLLSKHTCKWLVPIMVQNGFVH